MRKADFVIIAAALAAFLIPFFWADSGVTAQVFVKGELRAELELDKNTSFVINDGGFENTVVVENGSVYISDSNCPDKLCENQKIRKSGQSLICLPNKVVVVIKGGKDETDVIL